MYCFTVIYRNLIYLFIYFVHLFIEYAFFSMIVIFSFSFLLPDVNSRSQFLFLMFLIISFFFWGELGGKRERERQTEEGKKEKENRERKGLTVREGKKEGRKEGREGGAR